MFASSQNFPGSCGRNFAGIVIAKISVNIKQMIVKLGSLGLNSVKIVNLPEIKHSPMLLRTAPIWNFLSFRKNGMTEASANTPKDADPIPTPANSKRRDSSRQSETKYDTIRIRCGRLYYHY